LGGGVVGIYPIAFLGGGVVEIDIKITTVKYKPISTQR